MVPSIVIETRTEVTVGPMDVVLEAFRSLTYQEWVLGTIIIMTGRREVKRQERWLVKLNARGERHQYDRLNCYANLLYGHALTVAGLGFLWDPMARAAWAAVGVSRLMLLPGPCDTPIFNRYPYRLVRNLFILALGYACIRYGLLPLTG